MMSRLNALVLGLLVLVSTSPTALSIPGGQQSTAPEGVYPTHFENWEWCAKAGQCQDAATYIEDEEIEYYWSPKSKFHEDPQGEFTTPPVSLDGYNRPMDATKLRAGYDAARVPDDVPYLNMYLPDGVPNSDGSFPDDPSAFDDPAVVGPWCLEHYGFCAPSPGTNGDPHYKQWHGQIYDFQGGCDILFLRAPSFQNGQGLEIHTRTKVRMDYSFIESAAIKIGDDILEISSYGDYFLNGVEGAPLPAFVGGLPVAHLARDEKSHMFDIFLEEDRRIVIKTLKDWVSVKIDQPLAVDFADSVGMMGNFVTGKLLARDGTRVITDMDEMGQEWQVQPEMDGMLFQTERAPQYPEKCIIPPPFIAEEHRQLREGSSRTITEEQAKEACAHWTSHTKMCVRDVLAAQDLQMAEEFV
ncbi:expressed unknown protein [Seminavis robusta]|uniref:VWFD domain-containing protein n=1 Tax=Seminavis robusta TaxID=568900 RepID=A0A9N8DCA2_9STRA|nr:expressed unknown protein [Seminavis robusta]|eukprot:Sro74_g040920.1 n/a (413) ;mRNA; f:112865-114341